MSAPSARSSPSAPPRARAAAPARDRRVGAHAEAGEAALGLAPPRPRAGLVAGRLRDRGLDELGARRGPRDAEPARPGQRGLGQRDAVGGAREGAAGLEQRDVDGDRLYAIEASGAEPARVARDHLERRDRGVGVEVELPHAERAVRVRELVAHAGPRRHAVAEVVAGRGEIVDREPGGVGGADPELDRGVLIVDRERVGEAVADAGGELDQIAQVVAAPGREQPRGAALPVGRSAGVIEHRDRAIDRRARAGDVPAHEVDDTRAEIEPRMIRGAQALAGQGAGVGEHGQRAGAAGLAADRQVAGLEREAADHVARLAVVERQLQEPGLVVEASDRIGRRERDRGGPARVEAQPIGDPRLVGAGREAAEPQARPRPGRRRERPLAGAQPGQVDRLEHIAEHLGRALDVAGVEQLGRGALAQHQRIAGLGDRGGREVLGRGLAATTADREHLTEGDAGAEGGLVIEPIGERVAVQAGGAVDLEPIGRGLGAGQRLLGGAAAAARGAPVLQHALGIDAADRVERDRELLVAEPHLIGGEVRDRDAPQLVLHDRDLRAIAREYPGVDQRVDRGAGRGGRLRDRGRRDGDLERAAGDRDGVDDRARDRRQRREPHAEQLGQRQDLVAEAAAAHQLDDHRGVAGRGRGDPARVDGRAVIARDQLGEDRALGLGQRLERELDDRGDAAVGGERGERRQAVARAEHEQRDRRRGVAEDVREQVEAVAIGAVRVVDHQRERGPGGQAREQRAERAERPAARVAVGLAPDQLAGDRLVDVRVVVGGAQHREQLAQGAIVERAQRGARRLGERGHGAAHAVGDAVEGVEADRLARVTRRRQAGRAVAVEVRGQRARDRGLAGAGGADDRGHRRPLAGARDRAREHGVAPHQRRRAAARHRLVVPPAEAAAHLGPLAGARARGPADRGTAPRDRRAPAPTSTARAARARPWRA